MQYMPSHLTTLICSVMSLVTSVLSILAFTLFIMGFIGVNKMELFVAYLLRIHKSVTLIGRGENQMASGWRTLFGQIILNHTQKYFVVSLNLNNNQLKNSGLGAISAL